LATAVGLALTTVGLFLIHTALPAGVIAVIVGAIFLASVCPGWQHERLTYHRLADRLLQAPKRAPVTEDVRRARRSPP
jgi:hypothetical protein